jgi:hypothetical protein
MSITATNAAWDHIQARELPPAAALVLLALARRHNQETGRCDPSTARIAQDTGLTRRGVQKALRKLEELRIIQTVFRKRSTGRGRQDMNSRYRISGGANSAGSGGEQSSHTPANRVRTKKEYRPSAFDDLAMSIDDDLIA